MANDLRQRRKEDHASESILQESKNPRFIRYKHMAQYVVMLGVVLLLSLPMLLAIRQLKSIFTYDEVLEDQFYPSEMLHLFQKHDRDDDHYLSLDEFEPIAMQLINRKLSTDYIQPILHSDQLVTLNAFFEPMNLSTMSKDFRFTFIVSGVMPFFLGLTHSVVVLLEQSG